MNKLKQYLEKWELFDPKKITKTPTSQIFKVRHKDDYLILKILTEAGKQYEALGAKALKYYNGCGAVRLIKDDPGAHLLAYIDGKKLEDHVLQGKDRESNKIICEVLGKIHKKETLIKSNFLRMKLHLESLFSRAQLEGKGSIFDEAAIIAKSLLATEDNIVLLHGDIHHENILKCSKHGWLVIDPQPIIGENIYDVANVFFNPYDCPSITEDKKMIYERSAAFSSFFNKEPQRILKFAFVHGCLSASWRIEDGRDPKKRLKICKILRELLRNIN